MDAAFTWGSGGKVVTEDEVARRRRLAQVLLERGMNPEPVAHWTQGLAKVANAIAGMRQNKFADEDAAAMRKSQHEGLMAALELKLGGGGAMPASPAPTPSAAPVEPPMAAAPAMPAPPKAGLSVPPAPDTDARPPIAIRKGEVPEVDRGFDLFTTRDGMNVPQGVGGRMAQLEGQAKAVAGRVLPKTDPVTGRAMPMLPPVPGEAPATAASAAAPATPQPAGVDPAVRDRLMAALSSGNPVARQMALGQIAQMSKDPAEREKAALQLQLLRAQAAKAEREASGTAPAEVGLQPIYGKDAQGNDVIIQLDKRGNAVRTAMPEGITVSNKPIEVDAGTETVFLDPQTRQVLQRVPKNIAKAEAEKVAGKAEGESTAGAQRNIDNATTTLKLLDQMEKHPALDNLVGGVGVSSYGNFIPGTEGYDLERLVKQAKGGALLTAVQQLQGMGALSNNEGEAATAAITRISTGLGEKDFKRAIADYREIVQRGMERAQSKLPGGAKPAATEGAPPSGIDPKVWNVMTPEERALWK